MTLMSAAKVCVRVTGHSAFPTKPLLHHTDSFKSRVQQLCCIFRLSVTFDLRLFVEKLAHKPPVLQFAILWSRNYRLRSIKIADVVRATCTFLLLQMPRPKAGPSALQALSPSLPRTSSTQSIFGSVGLSNLVYHLHFLKALPSLKLGQ